MRGNTMISTLQWLGIVRPQEPPLGAGEAAAAGVNFATALAPALARDAS